MTIKFLDELRADSPFAGNKILLGVMPPPDVIARFKRVGTAMNKLREENPSLGYLEAQKLAIEMVNSDKDLGGPPPEAGKRDKEK